MEGSLLLTLGARQSSCALRIDTLSDTPTRLQEASRSPLATIRVFIVCELAKNWIAIWSRVN
jgi:hypothetical protein